MLRRLFSKSLYKSQKLPLAEMTFSKDFTNSLRGDMYPLISKSENALEEVFENRYTVKNGFVRRMFTELFPFATYEVTFEGKCGFSFVSKNATATITFTESSVSFSDGTKNETVNAKIKDTAIVSLRPGAFDVYTLINNCAKFVFTFTSPAFSDSNKEEFFKNSYVCLDAHICTIKSVSAYIDSGVSQADIRLIKYENGEAIYENGRIYFTASIRMQASSFQGIFSWCPTTSNIELVGALFFDCGDGYWRNYLASSLLYDRASGSWLLWASSFEHKHIVCHSSFSGDVRFGVNVVDVTFMKESTSSDPCAFLGFKGDEDPDMIYNEADGLWYFALCRLVDGAYRYVFFKSESPFSDYHYIGMGCEGAETGGAFVFIENELSFICGNDFKKRSEYRLYSKDGMTTLDFDFCDGGFRGWGSLIPIASGTRKRYFLLTFDRINGSDYGWSYGNVYGFEMDVKK